MKKSVVLTILDGWGLGKHDETNPIFRANPQTIDFIRKNFPATALQASGLAVGLPWNEEGNSEVGHLNIGAGRIVYQHFLRISAAINNGSFFKNPVFLKAFNHVRANHSALHLVGLLTEGCVHAALKHLFALIALSRQELKDSKIFLHLFSDGRDSPPRSLSNLLTKLNQELNKYQDITIATISGRYYAMDRDGNWSRTQQTYQVIAGEGQLINDLRKHITDTYDRGLNDEYIEPVRLNETASLKDGDALIFFNFREDRMRQLTEAFINPNFNIFPVKKWTNLFIVTMTKYHKTENFSAEPAFPNEIVEQPLGQVLAENNKTQLRVAETEKYAHITYFFNGLREAPFENEFRILVPSNKIIHHDEKPEMMAGPITDRALNALNEESFDFILINYANPDIIAHTGNYNATLAAINAVDQQLSRLVKAVLNQGHYLIITADHGNAEILIDSKTGETDTKHNPSPVPFYLVASEFKKTKSEAKAEEDERLIKGIISDIAPTILELMKIKKPAAMTGQNLLTQIL